MTDELTDLQNATAFAKVQSAAESDANLAFIIFDANNFGKVNKTAGHTRGDEILKDFAYTLACAARANAATSFRTGGDEFVIICHKNFAEKIRDAVELRAGTVRFEDFAVSISGEIGETLRIADSRLQARKKLKKGEFSSGTN